MQHHNTMIPTVLEYTKNSSWKLHIVEKCLFCNFEVHTVLLIVHMALRQAGVNKGAWLLNHRCSTVEVYQFINDPEADDFPNLSSSSLSSGKIFVRPNQ